MDGREIKETKFFLSDTIIKQFLPAFEMFINLLFSLSEYKTFSVSVMVKTVMRTTKLPMC